MHQSSRFLTVCALGLTLFPGCYHMNGPYGAYRGNYYGASPGYGGYGGYPVYQGAPIQTLTPGQEYYPGSFAPNTISPSTTPPTFQDGTSTLQPLNDSSSPGVTPDGKTQPVPDPYFGNPQSTYSPPAQAEFSEANLQPANHSTGELPSIDGIREVRESSVGYPEAAELDPIPSGPPRELPGNVSADPMGNNYFPAHQPDPVDQSAPLFQPESAPPAAAPSQAEPIPAAGELQFEPPIPAKDFPEFNLPADPPAAMPEPETSAPRQAPALPADADPFFGTLNTQRISPFAYDAKYRWLKGIVTGKRNGSWSIVYSDNPHPNDQLAGQITLARNPLLSRLQDGDVVQVDGQVDPVTRDRLGKAVYLITSLKKVSDPTRTTP